MTLCRDPKTKRDITHNTITNIIIDFVIKVVIHRIINVNIHTIINMVNSTMFNIMMKELQGDPHLGSLGLHFLKASLQSLESLTPGHPRSFELEDGHAFCIQSAEPQP